MNRKRKTLVCIIATISSTVCASILGMTIWNNNHKISVINKNIIDNKPNDINSNFIQFDLSSKFSDKILEKYIKNVVINNNYDIIFDKDKMLDLVHEDIVSILSKEKKFKYNIKDIKYWFEYKFSQDYKIADFVIIWSDEYNANWKKQTNNIFYYDSLEFFIN
ncbi:MAG: hypothetical protein LBF02_02435 [Mycoplasmataceae bacterium]|jgi:hypothetical protein|nr:hypothetical protein [Mycoplasmataceae bacterium]